MIGIVSPSLAVDVTIEVKGEEVIKTCFHPGGQGVNTARVILELGEECRLLGFNGGESGVVLQALLKQAGIPTALIPTEHSTAAVFRITSGYTMQTLLQTLPPKVSRHEIDDLFSSGLLMFFESQVAVINGTLPKGMPREIPMKLIRHAKVHRVPLILDLAPEDLLELLPAGPSFIKPNLDQLRPFFALPPDPSDEEVLALAETLRERGAETVVLSLGHRGAACVSPEGRFWIHPPQLEALGEPGAGDSMVGGVAVALAQKKPLPDVLRLGAAAGSASVIRHGLGTAKREIILRMLDWIEIRTL